MSQHISGNMRSQQSQDFGEFVTVLGFRIRKEQIVVYMLGGPITKPFDPLNTEPPEEDKWSVNFMISNGWNSTRPHSKEECEAAIKMLDQMYAKEYGTTPATRALSALNLELNNE